jgi:hypothetical protein
MRHEYAPSLGRGGRISKLTITGTPSTKDRALVDVENEISTLDLGVSYGAAVVGPGVVSESKDELLPPHDVRSNKSTGSTRNAQILLKGGIGSFLSRLKGPFLHHGAQFAGCVVVRRWIRGLVVV